MYILLAKVTAYVVLQQLGVVSPLQLYFNPSLIFNNWQVRTVAVKYFLVVLQVKLRFNEDSLFTCYMFQIWRLVTSFVFFGYFGLNFLFHLIFIYYYCCMLEENSFRDRMADFIYMFLFGGTVIVVSFRYKLLETLTLT